MRYRDILMEEILRQQKKAKKKEEKKRQKEREEGARRVEQETRDWIEKKYTPMFADDKVVQTSKETLRKTDQGEGILYQPAQAPNLYRKFYVNTIYSKSVPGLKPLNSGYKYVGLFSQCEIVESNSYHGCFYIDTRYLNTTMHAVAVYQDDDSEYYREGFYRHFGQRGVCVCKLPVEVNIFFPEIRIGSHIYTDVIDAKTVQEAIEKFKNQKWRHYWAEHDGKPVQLKATQQKQEKNKEEKFTER